MQKNLPADAADVYAGLVAVKPGDGAVFAMYGGADYQKRQISSATDAIMQAGSTFKPFALIAALQQGISTKLARAKLGKRLPVIIDEAGPTVSRGRSAADAPGIDGTVHVASRRRLRPGDIVPVKIERADAYDLYGQTV